MYYSGDFEIKETDSAYIISVIGETDRIRIPKNDVEMVFSDEDPGMVAVLLGVIELSRHNETVSRLYSTLKYSPKTMIHDEDFLGKLNYLLESKTIYVDALIDKFLHMKYFEIVKFFDEDFAEDI